MNYLARRTLGFLGAISFMSFTSAAESEPATWDLVAPSELVCSVQPAPKVPVRPEPLPAASVTAQATVTHGKVVEMHIISGPVVYFRSVRDALFGYACSDLEKSATVRVTFRFNGS